MYEHKALGCRSSLALCLTFDLMFDKSQKQASALSCGSSYFKCSRAANSAARGAKSESHPSSDVCCRSLLVWRRSS